MRTRSLVTCAVLLLVAACGSLYDDTGSAAPASPWPWVCEDGGLAPESGCVPPPSGTDGGAADGEVGGD